MGEAKWEAGAYRRIASATLRGDDIAIRFADGSDVVINRARLIRPGARGLRWDEMTFTTREVVVPTAGEPVEVPWSTIRVLTDQDYAAYLATVAAAEARRVGARLAALRARRGLSGKDLAERAGIAPQSLSRIEHGRHDLAFSTLQRLLAAMDYGLADLAAELPTPADPSGQTLATRTCPARFS